MWPRGELHEIKLVDRLTMVAARGASEESTCTHALLVATCTAVILVKGVELGELEVTRLLGEEFRAFLGLLGNYVVCDRL